MVAADWNDLKPMQNVTAKGPDEQMVSPVEMVSRVSVPFPDILLRQRGKAKYGTGRNKPLTSRRMIIVLDSLGTAAADSKTEINPCGLYWGSEMSFAQSAIR